METRSAKRKKPCQNLPPDDHGDEDRISNLPDEILHHVTSFLPIKSAAQTSVLSRRWRDLWYSFPDLDFTTAYSPPHIDSACRDAERRVRLHVARCSRYADQILSLIEKHSDVRVFRFRASLTFSRLSCLVRHAVKHNVQELDIEVSTCDYFNFPRSLIGSSTLRSLRLKSCHPGFRLPPLDIMKEGFRSLSVLSLSHLILCDQPHLTNLFTDSSFPLLKKLHLEACFDLRHLRVESPVLEDLSLENCYQLQDLEIRVQKLKKFRVRSCFDAYSSISRVEIEAPDLRIMFWSYNAVTEECILHDLTHLQEASVGFYLLPEDLSASKIISVWNFLSGMSYCHSLTLESQCIEILSKHNNFAGLSLCSFNKLKYLELATGFNKHNNSGLASIFRSSPTIHTITITIIRVRSAQQQEWNKDLWQAPSSGEERHWESQAQSLSSFLHHLKVVKIHGFTECANDVSLVKFLLKQGKVLQQVFLSASLSKGRDSLLREKIKSQIMGFSRASSNANIVFQ
ncbi:putative F-box/FBD/LRR-repeat protein [Salvia divinorum]|uniref:F-box/FBD/LRR-repeat protein n=1 Tax=Salvia divinorum TaxID=28513 RepID=A0ABD1HWE8_SALDI